MKARPISRLGRSAWFYWRHQRGAAAVEFALVLSLLVIPILNVVDFGIYVYQRMELDNAGQAAVQKAWAQCAATGKIPATINSNCPGLTGNMTAAAHSTPLGTSVTITSVAEKYCCPGSGTSLTCQGSVATTTPTNCTSGDPPGDYISATMSYTYAPLFSGISVVSLLPTPITRVASMRLG